MATVVLTGVGAPGQLGETVARTFAQRGDMPILVGRRDEQLRARVADLTASGFPARSIACDLADPHAVASLAGTIHDLSPAGIAALVHMAGGFDVSGPVADSAVEIWNREISINLATAYLTARALIPQLRLARGSLVFVASASALPGAAVAGISAYAVAKSGVITLMRAIADEERQHGVRANAIAPTAIRTAANRAAMGDDAPYVEREDVAASIAYLCSPEARAITGQVVALT